MFNGGVKSDWYNLTEARSTGLLSPSVDVQNKDLFLCRISLSDSSFSHYSSHCVGAIAHLPIFVCSLLLASLSCDFLPLLPCHPPVHLSSISSFCHNPPSSFPSSPCLSHLYISFLPSPCLSIALCLCPSRLVHVELVKVILVLGKGGRGWCSYMQLLRWITAGGRMDGW